MTVSQRIKAPQPDELETVNEPGLQFHCDACSADITHSVRVRCAHPDCEHGDGVDVCPACFCKGAEFANHNRIHPYRVVEAHSYPIFTEDWGADEELLLLDGILAQGLGNWQAIAEHVGTRTKKEVEEHYNAIYIDSPSWPLPPLDRTFTIEPTEFHRRKRQRIEAMRADTERTVAKIAPTSAPGNHEIATFLPGRLEFEHELDNDTEELIKDLEFGMVYQHGGDEMREDEHDLDVKARAKWGAPRLPEGVGGDGDTDVVMNGIANGHGHKPPSAATANGNGKLKRDRDGNPKHEEPPSPIKDDADADDEPHQPPPTETEESLNFKLSLLDMYQKRREKREEGKELIFERGLLEFKKIQAADKKRSKDEKEIAHRLRPFARLQTAQDYEVFLEGIYHEHVLRKRIQELQEYRRLGLKTSADIDKYDQDLIKRIQAKSNPTTYSSNLRTGGGRQSSSFADDHPHSRRSLDRESTPNVKSSTGPPTARPQPAPLNLANAPSLHLLTPAEQTLCSQLRILPRPYLVIKETFVREFARRGGKLRRREARDLVKIDVNKVGRVWDFLVQAGYLKIPDAALVQAAANGGAAGGLGVGGGSGAGGGEGATPTPGPGPSQEGSPVKPMGLVPPGPSLIQPLLPPPIPQPPSTAPTPSAS